MEDISWLYGRKFLVIGLGMTGCAAATFLAERGADVAITDTRADLSRFANALKKVQTAGARFVTAQAVADEKIDEVVISPGLSLDHALVRGLREAGAGIMSEIELAYRLARGRTIAVTGTNGKTTVTGLIGHILAGVHGDVRVTGNIGIPLIENVAGSTAATIFVTEVSSYQLETCETFAPHVSVVLNLQEDHQERHGSMEAYAAAKRRILERQGGHDAAILNMDDDYVRAMAGYTAAHVFSLSTREAVSTGGFVRDGRLVVRINDYEADLGAAGDMLLKGEHNHLNALAAALAAMLCDAPADAVRERLRSFRGYEHRIEFTDTKNGVDYINDSKSTNTDSTLAAIRAFAPRPIVLILGGDDKGLDYGSLYGEIKERVKHAVVMGPGLRRMFDELRAAGFASVDAAGDMYEAVRLAAAAATAGDVVLLSPASSSFDLFTNFEHRGMEFKNAVRHL